MLGYTALLSSLSILRYGLWVARGDDLGVFEQGLWLIMHDGLRAISTYTGHPILADGASSVLILLAPVYAVGGVGLLLVLQTFALGIGYYLVRRLGSDLGLAPANAHILGVIYLLYPTILAVNLYDFHPQSLGVPLLLGAICAVAERRWVSYVVLLLLAALVGGSAAVALVGLGIVLLLQGRSAWGAAAALVGLCIGGMDTFGLIPHLMHGAADAWLAIYGSIASTSSDVALGSLVRPPLSMLGWATQVRSWEYIAWLVGPLAGLAVVLRLRLVNMWWIPSLLLMELNLVSGLPSASSPFTEYSVLAVPFIMMAGIAGCRGLLGSREIRRSWTLLAPVAVLLIVLGALQFRSYWHSAPPNTSALEAAIAVVPSNAPVMAQDFVLPHLANRAQEWQLAALGSFTVPTGTYLVFDASATSRLASQATMARAKALLANNEQTAILYSHDGVTVGRELRSIGGSE